MGEVFRRFADRISEWVGTSWAFFVALAVVIVWAITGPLFHFSDTWQLLINTGTTVATFLMVFLIQATQNRQDLALHLKLDELIRANAEARNRFTCLEGASLKELEEMRQEFLHLRGGDSSERPSREQAPLSPRNGE